MPSESALNGTSQVTGFPGALVAESVSGMAVVTGDLVIPSAAGR